jgi:dihydroorotase
MPNTVPTLTRKEAVERRLGDAQAAAEELERSAGGRAPFYAIYAGLTADPEQIEEMAGLYARLAPRVAGFKLFAGRSTGDLAVIEPEKQRSIWHRLAQLGYRGVVAVHCEKEERFHPERWNPERPASHSEARPEEAEEASVKDQIRFAEEAGFEGNLHICHVSTPGALEEIRRTRERRPPFSLSCGATPHHLLLDVTRIPEGPEGLLYKVNPPLRSPGSRSVIFQALIEGTIDWIESDHAPHLPADKYESRASGIPSLCAWPLILGKLSEAGLSRRRLERITAGAVLEVFEIEQERIPDYRSEELAETGDTALCSRYEANCWRNYLEMKNGA